MQQQENPREIDTCMPLLHGRSPHKRQRGKNPFRVASLHCWSSRCLHARFAFNLLFLSLSDWEKHFEASSVGRIACMLDRIKSDSFEGRKRMLLPLFAVLYTIWYRRYTEGRKMHQQSDDFSIVLSIFRAATNRAEVEFAPQSLSTLRCKRSFG